MPTTSNENEMKRQAAIIRANLDYPCPLSCEESVFWLLIRKVRPGVEKTIYRCYSCNPPGSEKYIAGIWVSGKLFTKEEAISYHREQLRLLKEWWECSEGDDDGKLILDN